MSKKLHKLRAKYYPLIHKIKDLLGNKIGTNLYAMYPMYSREYICSKNISIEKSYELMENLGFKYEPIAALKIWEPNRSIENGSFVRREGGVSDPHQLHIHIFHDEETGETIFAGHYEYSWITEPKKHYRGELMEFDVAKEMFNDMLENYEEEMGNN